MTAQAPQPAQAGAYPLTPATHPAQTAATAGWSPTTERDATLLDAAQRGDSDAYIAALLTAPLLLPVEAPPPGEPGTFAWPVDSSDGRTFVLSFTSDATISACARPGQEVCYRQARLIEIAEQWPDAGWLLAVNPGLPICAVLDADTLREAQARPDPALPGEEALAEAIATGDDSDAVAALLRARFAVPVTPGGVPTRDLANPRFPWLVSHGEDGSCAVTVFTSPARLRQVLGEHEHVMATSMQLTQHWPDPHHWLAVNPGTPLAMSLAGQDVIDLGRWLEDATETIEQELHERRRGRDLAAIPGGSADLVDVSVGAPVAGGVGGPEGDAGRPTEGDGVGSAAPVTGEASEPSPGVPLLLQLVVPPDYVVSYLEQGYDRAVGLLHAWAGPGRETPLRLYRRLDLLRDGSPFSADDGWTAVLRWEPNEETPASLGEGEPRMEAIVVPDGAELHRVCADGRDDLIAVYDAAGHRWRPAA